MLIDDDELTEAQRIAIAKSLRAASIVQQFKRWGFGVLMVDEIALRRLRRDGGLKLIDVSPAPSTEVEA